MQFSIGGSFWRLETRLDNRFGREPRAAAAGIGEELAGVSRISGRRGFQGSLPLPPLGFAGCISLPITQAHPLGTWLCSLAGTPGDREDALAGDCSISEMAETQEAGPLPLRPLRPTPPCVGATHTPFSLVSQITVGHCPSSLRAEDASV